MSFTAICCAESVDDGDLSEDGFFLDAAVDPALGPGLLRAGLVAC